MTKKGLTVKNHKSYSSKGGETTKKRYGNKVNSLAIRIRWAKTPADKARLEKEMAALVASKKAAKA